MATVKRVGVLLTAFMWLGWGVFPARAADVNYASFVSVVRGREFWRSGFDMSFLKDQDELLFKYSIPSTWLLQYDAIIDKQIVEQIGDRDRDRDERERDEMGIFLEVTPKLSRAAFVNYDWFSEKWERADKLFLSGYDREARKKLIDTAFIRFKEVFGYFPKSVGAWHIDGWSLEYMHKQYGVEAVLGLSDQYSTDGYQVWGQYVGEPYYPDKRSVIEPAFDVESKLGVVKFQWAGREPLLSYGRSGEFSTYSVQVNDYFRFHKLGPSYIRRLIEIYTKDISGKLAHVTLGLEVGELEKIYLPGLEAQLKVLSMFPVKVVTLGTAARMYNEVYPELSPYIHLSSEFEGKRIDWRMSSWYRAGILTQGNVKKLVDLRLYHQSGYRENDQLVADDRHNLYRVVPAVFDEVGLSTSFPLEGTEIDFEERRIVISGEGAQRLVKEISKFKVRVKPEGNKWVVEPIDVGDLGYGKVGQWDRLRQFAGRFVPDIRVSKIEGGWVAGLRVGPETLWGVRLVDLKVGRLSYDFPILEAFLNLDKLRKPTVEIYGRWEDEMVGFSGEKAKKSADYGEGSLTAGDRAGKIIENSKYVILE